VEYEVRRATPEDAEAIARVHVASWQAAYRGLFPDTYLDSLDWRDRVQTWQEATTDPSSTNVLVAVSGPQVLGLASSGPPRDREFRAEVCWELYAIYLDPTHWSQGTGTALLTRTIDELPPRVRTLVLWVLAGNGRAITFYQRQDFRPDGARKRITRGDHTALQLRYRRTLRRPH
jgi:RimJ/RimL family protein N-acetyltransferase